MDINIADDQLKDLIEKEVKNCVRQKIVNLMNDGCANWFTQQNIKSITYDIILGKVTNDIAKETVKRLNKEELLIKLSECMAKQMLENLDIE